MNIVLVLAAFFRNGKMPEPDLRMSYNVCRSIYIIGLLGELFGSKNKERMGKTQMQLLHFLQQLPCTSGR